MTKAVVLLSGGLDSITVMAIAKDLGLEVFALSFDYEQKNRLEIEQSKKIAEHYNASYHLIKIDSGLFKGSSLVDNTMQVNLEKSGSIPLTYVPARNMLFLSYALSFAESREIYKIFIGANQVDFSGYPDCRGQFLESFARTANLATKNSGTFEVIAPLLDLSKREIIARGLQLGVDYSLSSSCYAPIGKLACGKCESCFLRIQGFKDNAVEDPCLYSV